jgi:outer membrane protein OmpA-like peptidoglycan-associated protein
LQPVGELKVAPIVFVRGSARLSSQSERHLDDLTKRLESFPNFYLRIIGRTRSEGDADANRRLAESRAAASAEYLRRQGVLPERLRTEAAPESAASGAGQAVSFEVGQPAY